MLAAWQGIGGFTEERASLRTWLYKIATNRCLNARRAASRRPAREWDVSQFEPPVPTPRDEAVWLQPFPDALLEGAADVPPGPEARYEQTEAISLAFVTALQLLPPRQVAVLILRDVLGFHASEVAGMLEVTVQSVNSALKRARASLDQRRPPAAGREPPPPPAHPPRMRAAPRLRFVQAGVPMILLPLWPIVLIASWMCGARQERDRVAAARRTGLDGQEKGVPRVHGQRAER